MVCYAKSLSSCHSLLLMAENHRNTEFIFIKSFKLVAPIQYFSQYYLHIVIDSVFYIEK